MFPFGSVAVDLGASSGRCAAGRLVGERIEFEVIHQAPHEASEVGGRLVWDLPSLIAFPERAIEYAKAHFERATIGIDSWGVDHGFVDRATGVVMGPPVCYRDLAHARAMDRLRERWDELFVWTGIQRQPFNTVFQLLARRIEDPTLSDRADWFILPDLLGYALTGVRHHELTQASTTQLLGLDGAWCDEAFEAIGWPVPELAPKAPGRKLAALGDGVDLVSVGSHDTASAVLGFGRLDATKMFVNVGTWSLAGTVVAQPIVNAAVKSANLTNERTADGCVRLLKNVPGFYVLNRLHDELGLASPMAQWVGAADTGFQGRVNLLDEAFFNPTSMADLCRELTMVQPESPGEWAALGLFSLADAIAAVPSDLKAATGHDIQEVRLGGGGSQSAKLCQAVADRTGLPVRAGPPEATVLGNLAAQFMAAGACDGWEGAMRLVEASAAPILYTPNA